MKRYILLILLIPLISFGQESACDTIFNSHEPCKDRPVDINDDVECDESPLVVVFEDNFDLPYLDMEKWEINYQGCSSTDWTNTKQWLVNRRDNVPYTNNLAFQDGYLRIIDKYEPAYHTFTVWHKDGSSEEVTSLFRFTSGEIISKHFFHFGKYEIKCQIPSGDGYWPAYWMFGQDPGEVRHEIDVFEFYRNHNDWVRTDLHFCENSCPDHHSGPDYSLANHTYSTVWEEHKSQWYVDNDLKRTVYRYEDRGILGDNLECDEIFLGKEAKEKNYYPFIPVQIRCGLGIHSGYDGNAYHEPTYPPTEPFNIMYVDYIKFSKRSNDCSGPVIITNGDQLDFVTPTYNTLSGDFILMYGNAELNSTEFCQLVAKDYVHIKPGVIITQDIAINVDPMLCSDRSSSGINKLGLVNPTEEEFNSPVPDDIKVYPNPSDGLIRIELHDNLIYDLSVIDHFGKIVHSDKLNSQLSVLDIRKFGKGIYLLRFHDPISNDCILKKVIYN